ncbi:MAG: MraY family glycosyltransferase, partial [Candidatus Veblenbacteria bacterium]|nr:MraY family glycosyltransferase [Candidatus Veblenbacteria bacterium]
SPAAILGLTFGGLVLMVGGYLDDRYHITPLKQFVWPVLAAFLAVGSGVVVRGITNPFGGTIHFDALPLVPGLVGFLWLLGMMYTTKLLDGLDGLATGVGAIGSLIIFGLTQFTPFYQPSVGLLAVMLAGACAGFLAWNWYPARIFLGEGGSLYIGFVLGVLAIISGAKIATALLVMGVPALDVAWVIVRRWFWERHSLAQADRKHLHYRLLDVGLSHRQAVVVLYLITASFGLTSLFLGTQGKVFALIILVGLMAVLGVLLVLIYRYKKTAAATNK